ncbi:MAG: oligopeptide transport system ATP-binding protein [Planctomycetota bacterium]|jgi:oligopeptide transport system ATP-binding protein
MTVLSVENLQVRFETHHGSVRAVDGVSYSLEAGETLGIVGESGSGKSVSSLAVMGLVPTPPGVVEATSMRFGDRELTQLSRNEMRSLRGKSIAMIFQDPMTALNPFLTVGRQLTEVLELHEGVSHREARKRSAIGLGEVGIPDPEKRLDVYPHELSGGMRQRVMIAMALLCKPAVLFADEPTTALDVTIQAQVLELLGDLQEKHGMAIVLVTHDLGVVAGMADRIAVMYGGRLVEKAPTTKLFKRPLHPYTSGLLASIPKLSDDPDAPLHPIPGNPPNLAHLPPGCAFAPRCSIVKSHCTSSVPPLAHLTTEEDDRASACFEWQSLAYVREDAGGQS